MKNFRALFLLTLLFYTSPARALTVEGHSAAANDRFANDSGFIGNSFDWSGVGRATTGTAGKGGHWATMISSNVFLSANHYYPPTGQTLYFYPDNNPGSAPITRAINGAQRIGTTDLWIGHLNQTLPSTIQYYNWANQTLNTATYALSTLANENALVTGITTTSGSYGADKRTSMAVGRNTIDKFIDNLTVSGTTAPAIRTLHDLSGDANHGSDETQLVGGDSGAPLFINDGGALKLVGINWAIGTVDINPNPIKTENRDASFYSYVGNYSSDIQKYIDSNPATPVPEPSLLTSLMIGLAGACFFKRR